VTAEVKFVSPFEGFGEVRGGRIAGIFDDDGEGLEFGVALEFATEHFPEPWPLPHGTGSRMDGYEAAAAANVLAEGCLLLFVVENFIVGVGEDKGFVAFKVGTGENGWVIGSIDDEVVFGAEFFDGGNTGGEIVVDV